MLLSMLPAVSLVRFTIFSEFFASSTKRYQARALVSSSISVGIASTLFYSAGRESVIGSGTAASLSSALNVNGLTLFPGIYAGMPLLVDDLRRVSHYERLTPHYETYTCTRIIGLHYKKHLSFSLLLSHSLWHNILYSPARAVPLPCFFAVFFIFSFGLPFEPIFRIASPFVMTLIHILPLLSTPALHDLTRS